MSNIVKWIERETIRLLPAFIYFELTFILLHFSQGLMLQPGDVRFTSYVGAIIGGVLAAKVILITESMPFIDAFPNKPIIYNITWKFLIYSFFVLFVQAVDHMAHQLYHTGSWHIALTRLKADFSMPLFWGVQIWVLLLFLFFIVFSAVVRIVGGDKLRKLFFGS